MVKNTPDRVWVTKPVLIWSEDCVLYKGVPDLPEARRQLVRRFISQRLDLPETNMRLSVISTGQPFLEGVPGITVNWSHRLGFLFVALAKGRLGVDVELVDAELPFMDIAEGFFSSSEVRVLRTLPPRTRSLVFFLLWTVREAYVKALGLGLDESLTRALDLSPLLQSRATLEADITQTICAPGLTNTRVFSGIRYFGGRCLRLTKLTAL